MTLLTRLLAALEALMRRPRRPEIIPPWPASGIPGIRPLTPILTATPASIEAGASVQVTLTNGLPSQRIDWGDGAVVQAQAQATHIYSAAGTRSIRLLDAAGQPVAGVPPVVITVRGAVAPLPTLSLPTSATTGQSVTISVGNAATGDVLDFGDGQTVTAQATQSHVYTAAGALTVRVLRDGVVVASQSLTVTAAVPVVAVSPSSPAPGQTVTATLQNFQPGDLLDWRDKSAQVAAQATATHSYSAAGTYVVAIKRNRQVVASVSVTVAAAPAPAVATRERNADNLPWNTTPLKIEENVPSSYSAYLQTDGSIRLPNQFRRSDNPDVMPVILKTPRPVVIDGGATFARGMPISGAFGAILTDYPDADLTIREHLIYSGNPNVAAHAPAKAICVPYGVKRFDVVGVEMYGTGGVMVRRDTNSSQRILTLRYRRIYIKNLDGRVSDPTQPGGWRTGNRWQVAPVDWLITNILQLTDVRLQYVDVFDVGDVEMESEAGQSRFEDAWAFQRSGGSVDKEMLLERIKMRGCYVYDEAWTNQAFYGNNGPVGTGNGEDGNTSVDSTGRYKDARGKVHSGGMGLTSDGVSGSAAMDVISRNIRFKQLYALDFANYGLAIQGGVDTTLEDCVAARSGYVHNLLGGRTVKIPTKHLPLQLQYGPGGSAPDRSRWGGHVIKNTRFGIRSFLPSSGTVTDEGGNPDGSVYKITPNCTENGVVKPAFTEINNTYLTGITPDMVDGFWRELDAYWAANRIAIGLADRIPVAP